MPARCATAIVPETVVPPSNRCLQTKVSSPVLLTVVARTLTTAAANSLRPTFHIFSAIALSFRASQPRSAR